MDFTQSVTLPESVYGKKKIIYIYNNKGSTFTFPVKAALFILSTNISRLNIHGPKKEQIAKRF